MSRSSMASNSASSSASSFSSSSSSESTSAAERQRGPRLALYRFSLFQRVQPRVRSLLVKSCFPYVPVALLFLLLFIIS